MKYAEFYRQHYGIQNEEVLQKLSDASRLKTFRAGECICAQGTVPTHLCLLARGVVRGFMLSSNGKDITDCISYLPGQTVMPESDLSKPSTINIEALEETELIQIPMTVIREMMATYPELYETYEQLLVKASMMHRDLKIAVYQYTAMQRYQWFLQEYPGLIDRIPHKYIAAFLDMTPVTLSNVRHELKHTMKQKDPVHRNQAETARS